MSFLWEILQWTSAGQVSRREREEIFLKMIWTSPLSLQRKKKRGGGNEMGGRDFFSGKWSGEVSLKKGLFRRKTKES